jgi:hypothetical protein
VVHPYGTRKLVHIVKNAGEFVEKAESELKFNDRHNWLLEVDNFLRMNSWDLTCMKMLGLINQHIPGATAAQKLIDKNEKNKEVEHV